MDQENVQQTCAGCGKRMDATWFARMSEGNSHWALFCSPECVLSHIDSGMVIPWDDTNFIRTAEAFANPGRA